MPNYLQYTVFVFFTFNLPGALLHLTFVCLLYTASFKQFYWNLCLSFLWGFCLLLPCTHAPEGIIQGYFKLHSQLEVFWATQVIWIFLPIILRVRLSWPILRDNLTYSSRTKIWDWKIFLHPLESWASFKFTLKSLRSHLYGSLGDIKY